MTNITKDQFDEYKRIRETGKTNMMNVKKVSKLSAGVLNPEDVTEIIQNYDKYQEEYGE